jgi:23S rRNA pseudouridine1911/1915/1917 synthase
MMGQTIIRKLPPVAVEPSILWEDASLLVCRKPPGLPTIAQQTDDRPSLSQWIVENRPQCERSSEKEGEGGLCHRLDTESSGILVAAKDRTSYRHLREQFSEEVVTKRYICLVEGSVREAGKIESYLYGRHRGSKKVSVAHTKKPRSRHARLGYSPQSRAEDLDCTLLTVDLYTGFRHQIRAQLADIGHPLVGDTMYGSQRELSSLELFLSRCGDVQRKFFLHSSELHFFHPKTGEKIQFFDLPS